MIYYPKATIRDIFIKLFPISTAKAVKIIIKVLNNLKILSFEKIHKATSPYLLSFLDFQIAIINEVVRIAALIQIMIAEIINHIESGRIFRFTMDIITAKIVKIKYGKNVFKVFFTMFYSLIANISHCREFYNTIAIKFITACKIIGYQIFLVF